MAWPSEGCWTPPLFDEGLAQVGRHSVYRLVTVDLDQHALIALMAPRPVLLTNAGEDQWANPAGQFDMLRLAAPAWRLLGAGDLGAEAAPEFNRLVDSKLGYWIRPGQHSMGPEDWNIFLAFADRWL